MSLRAQGHSQNICRLVHLLEQSVPPKGCTSAHPLNLIWCARPEKHARCESLCLDQQRLSLPRVDLETCTLNVGWPTTHLCCPIVISAAEISADGIDECAMILCGRPVTVYARLSHLVRHLSNDLLLVPHCKSVLQLICRSYSRHTSKTSCCAPFGHFA